MAESFGPWGLIFAFCFWHICVADKIFLTDKYCIGTLPLKAALSEHSAKVLAQCVGHCNENTECKIFAFSEKKKKCKIYNHSGLSFLPELADTDDGYRVYYDRAYCPDGWTYNGATKACYKVFTDALRTRQEALDLCEDHVDSELVTTESVEERDWVYDMLNQHSGLSTQRFWLYNYRFGNNQWARTVPEVAGWERRAGWSSGHEQKTYPQITLEQCMHRCEKVYGNVCIAVGYRAYDGYCWIKRYTKQITAEYNGIVMYERTGKARPGSWVDNYYQNAGWFYIDGHHQRAYQMSWTDCIRWCRDLPGCVSPRYRVSDGHCWAKTHCVRTWGHNGDYMFLNLPDNKDNCLRGWRYQDRCVRYSHDARGWQHNMNMAGQTGNRLWYPRTTREATYFYNVWWNYYAHTWLPYKRSGGVWRNEYTNEVLSTSNSGYQWIGGKPDNNADNYCVMLHLSYRRRGHTLDNMDDYGCGSSFQARFEQAAREQKPMDCKFTPPGREYFGYQTVSGTGKGCQVWTTSPYTADKNLLPEDDMTYARAYCRNPDPADASGPFCMTIAGKESCDIPMCPEVDWKAGESFDDAAKPYAHMVKESGVFKWQTAVTTEKAYAVCEIKREQFCPIRTNKKCFWMPNKAGTWDEARVECAKAPGWILAEFDTQEEIYAVHDFAYDEAGHTGIAAMHGYWVNSRKTVVNGNDEWNYGSDGRSIPDGLWHIGFPSSAAGDTTWCLRLVERGYDLADNLVCTEQLNIVCSMIIE